MSKRIAVGTDVALLCGMSDVATASELNRITSTIVGAAIDVHRVFGPGLLEHAYAVCLLHELAARGCRVEHQKSLPLVYRGITIDCAYRADLVVDGEVLIEVKAIDAVAPIHRRQVQTYLRLGDYRVGLLLNFRAATMKEGIERIVNRFPEGVRAGQVEGAKTDQRRDR